MKITGVRLFYGFTLLLGGVVLMPTLALAQVANGVGSAMNNVSYTGQGSNLILSVTSYVIGVSLGFWGLVRLKGWIDGQSNLGDGLWRIVGGAIMIASPFFIHTILDSFLGSWSAGTSSAGGVNRLGSLQGNYSSNGAWIGLDQAMVNFVTDIYQPTKTLCAWASWIIGIACFITGIYRLAQSGQAAQGRAPSMKGTIGYIFGGALMLAAGNVMDVVSTTIFGTATTQTFSSLAYSVPGASQTAVNNVVQALFAFVEIIGWIAFIRGIYLLIKLAQGGGDKTHAHAFSHIIFGAAAVNMYAVASMLQTTLGVSLVK